MFDAVRKVWAGLLGATRAPSRQGREEDGKVKAGGKRPHNIFEAAAAYVSASIEDDQDRIDEASGWVSPEALSFGVNELACRAVLALARERDESPRTVARALLGLPAA
ncbi:hypothetical protein OG616_04775 [Streptomyces antibioticus]|uniref:hypothetical protein n=1 Tax=Streptomyces antibioticus TaxID=1890 RepID=UPI00224CC3C8|nr:hypothetical protein [Streptomyces antibioticus]MCX5167329.1 hypothetical protein [Streptomyces antibioticus]